MSARTAPGALAVLLASAAFLASPARAQTWLAPKGEASFSIGYQYYSMKDHLTTAGDPFDWGRTRQDILLTGITYAISDRFTVSLGPPPFFLSRYTGRQPHFYPEVDADWRLVRDAAGQPIFRPPTIDDGSAHGSFADFRPEVRFMAVTEPIVVTPFVGIVFPSHGYEPLGHTTVGRDILELRTGVGLGRRLDPVLPDAYVQGRYAFSFRERVEGFRFNYSFVDLELGYFVSPSVTLRLLGAWQVAHDGLRDEEYPEAYLLATNWEEALIGLDGEQVRGRPGVLIGILHDQLDLQSTFNAGIGVSYAATPSLDLGVTAFRTISGRGGHATNLALSLVATWSFSPAQLLRKDGGSPRLRPSTP